METKVQEAWLDYISANKYKAEYYLIKYLKTLSKEQLADLLENFGREHSNVLMERKWAYYHVYFQQYWVYL